MATSKLKKTLENAKEQVEKRKSQQSSAAKALENAREQAQESRSSRQEALQEYVQGKSSYQRGKEAKAALKKVKTDEANKTPFESRSSRQEALQEYVQGKSSYQRGKEAKTALKKVKADEANKTPFESREDALEALERHKTGTVVKPLEKRTTGPLRTQAEALEALQEKRSQGSKASDVQPATVKPKAAMGDDGHVKSSMDVVDWYTQNSEKAKKTKWEESRKAYTSAEKDLKDWEWQGQQLQAAEAAFAAREAGKALNHEQEQALRDWDYEGGREELAELLKETNAGIATAKGIMDENQDSYTKGYDSIQTERAERYKGVVSQVEAAAGEMIASGRVGAWTQLWKQDMADKTATRDELAADLEVLKQSGAGRDVIAEVEERLAWAEADVQALTDISVLAMPDYEKMSQPIGGEKDLLHTLVNSGQAPTWATLNGAAGYDATSDLQAMVQMMTDEEKGIYNYLYNTGGENGAKNAQDYLGRISTRLTYRAAQQREEDVAALADQVPVISTVARTAMMPMEAAAGLGLALAGATGHQVNPYNSGLNVVRDRETIYETVNDKIGNPVGQFAYGVGTSMADMGMAALLSGGSGGVASMLMSLPAGASTAQGMLESGADMGTAVMGGAASAGVEWATEKLGFDRLFGNFTSGKMAGTYKDMLKATVKGFLPEGAEEVTSAAVNEALDRWLMGENSQRVQQIRQGVESGLSVDEAIKASDWAFVRTLGENFLAGGVAGGLMEGGSYAAGAANARAAAKEIKAALPGVDETLMLEAMEMEAGVREKDETVLTQAYAQMDEEQEKQLEQQRHAVFEAPAVVNGSEGVVAGVERSGEGGKVLVKQGGKETAVPLSEVEFQSEEQKQAYGYAMAFGDANVARQFLAGYEKSHAPLQNYVKGFKAAYAAGRSNRELMGVEKVWAKAVPDAVRELAYAAGQRSVAEENARLDMAEDVEQGIRKNIQAMPRMATEDYTGAVNQVRRTQLSASQATQMAMLDTLGKKYGTQYIIVDSFQERQAANQHLGTAAASVQNGSINGVYKAGTNQMVIALDAEGGNLLRAAGHESWHYIKEHSRKNDYVRGDADALQAFVLEKLQATEGYDLETRIAQKQEQYQRLAGQELDREGAIEEIVADSLVEVLATEENVRELMERNATVGEKVFGFIKRFLKEVRTALRSLGGKNAEARAMLEQDEKTLAQIAEHFDRVMIEVNAVRESEGAADGDGGVKYAIKTLPDGKQYVEESRSVLSGNDPVKWRGQIISYINHEIRNGHDVTVYASDGTPLTITRDTAGKAAFRNQILMKDGTKRLMNDEEYAVKLRAEGHIDEIAQTSRIQRAGIPDRKNHAFARDGFDYRTAYWKDKTGYYKLDFSVGKNGTLNTVYNIGKIKETEFPGANARRSSKAQVGKSVNNSLTQKSIPVNKKFSLSDEAYLSAVNAGNMEKAQQMVDEAAERQFKDSKIRGEDGKLLKVYHGTKADFTVFDTSKQGGVNGTAEGYGIYLSDSQEITNVYGNRQIGAYANITKPATSWKKSITVQQLIKLIEVTCQKEAERMVVDDEYLSVKEALRDTWISNYVDTYSSPSMAAGYRNAANDILQMNDNDMAIIQEVMVGMGIRSYADAEAFYDEMLTPATGFDGFWTTWQNENLGGDKNVILALRSSQVKYADPATYDDDGRLIPLSERFNQSKPDIRYSIGEDDQLVEDKYFQRSVDRWDGKPSGGRMKIGRIKAGSIYTAVGLPDAELYMDYSKAAKALAKHGDHLTKEHLKQIPEMLASPVVITEPINQQVKNTVNVFGEMQGENGKPIMVSIMMRPDRTGSYLLNVVRTMEMRQDTDRLITDDSVLYISRDKKRTAEWFQGLGNSSVPFAGTKSGFIRSISYSPENVNRYSLKDVDATNATMETLLEENRALRDTVRALNQQLKGEGGTLDEKAVRRVASGLKKQYASTVPLDTLTENLMRAFDAMQNAENTRQSEAAMAMMGNIALDMVQKSQTAEREAHDASRDLRERFRKSRIGLSEMQWQEAKSLFGTTRDFRRAVFGKWNVPAENGYSMARLDKIWDELVEEYPQYFKADASEGDMVQQVLEMLDRTAIQYANPYGAEIEQVASSVAAEIYQEYLGVKQKNAPKDPAVDVLMDQLADAKKTILEQKRGLRKAARTVADMQAKGERQALRRKQNQDYTQVKNEIIRKKGQLLKKLEAPRSGAFIPASMHDAVHELLKAIDFEGKLGGGTNKPLTREMLDRARDEYKKLNLPDENGGTGPLAAFYNGDLEHDFNLLAVEADGLRAKELSMKHMQALRNIVAGYAAAIVNEDRLFMQERRESLQEVGDDLLASMSMRKEHTVQGPVREWFARGLQQGLMKPVTAFHQFKGTAMEPVWKALRKAEGKHIRHVEEATAYLKEALGKYDQHKSIKEEGSKKKRETAKEIAFEYGQKIKLTDQELMTLYATAKREQLVGTQHLTRGGFTLQNAAKGSSMRPVVLTEKDIQTIGSSLTQQQKDYVEHMVAYLSGTCADWGNEVTLELYGVEKFHEDFYIPFSVNKNYVKVEPATEQDSRIKTGSFTKALTANASNPLEIKPFTEIWCQHVEKMSDYNAFVLPIEDMTRLMNYKNEADGVKASMNRAYGKQTTSYIMSFLRRLNGNSRNEMGESWLGGFMGRAKGAAVTFNLSVAIQQMGSAGRAMAMIDPKYFMQGTVKAALHGKKDGHRSFNASYSELEKHAPIAVEKSWGYFDTNMSRGMYQRARNTTMDKLNDAGGKLAEMGDKMTWARIWEAVKAETTDTYKEVMVGSEEYYKLCADRFTDVIDNTQVVDSIFQRAEWAAEKGMMKNFMAFMSEPLSTYNMVYRCIWDIGNARGKEAKTKAVGKLTRTMSAIVVSSAMTAALKSFVTALRDRDNEEKDEDGNILRVRTYWDKYVDAIPGAFKDNILGIGTIFTNAISDATSGFGGGSDLTTGWIGNLYTGAVQMGKIITGEKDSTYENWEKAMYKMLQGSSSAMGVGFGNLWRDVKSTGTAVWEYINQDMLAGAAWDNTLPLEQRLKAAQKNYVYKKQPGDMRKQNTEVYYTLMLCAYEEEGGMGKTFQAVADAAIDAGATKSGLISGFKSRLRAGEDNIPEAAKALVEGDMSTYNRCVEELQEAGLGLRAISSMVLAEANKLMPEEEPEDIAKETGADVAAELLREDVSDDPVAAMRNQAYTAASTPAELKKAVDAMREEGMTDKELRKKVTTSYRKAYCQAVWDGDTQAAREAAAMLKGAGVGITDDDLADWSGGSYARSTLYDLIRAGEGKEAVKVRAAMCKTQGQDKVNQTIANWVKQYVKGTEDEAAARNALIAMGYSQATIDGWLAK